MTESEHRKQMLVQQIADHRELMRLEMEVLQESNPIRPAVESGRRLLSLIGAIRPFRASGSGRGGAAGSAVEIGRFRVETEVLRTALPIVITVLRSVLESRRSKSPKSKR